MVAGRISPLLRRALLCFYIVFLLAMILVVLPVSVILKKLLHPLLKGRLKKTGGLLRPIFRRINRIAGGNL